MWNVLPLSVCLDCSQPLFLRTREKKRENWTPAKHGGLNCVGASLANRKPHPRVLRARFARFFLLVGKLREAVNSLGSLVVLVRSGVSILAILVSNPG